MDGTGRLFSPFLAAAPPGAPTQVVSYPSHVGDPGVLVNFVQASLPSDRPFVMVAESFSGPVAVRVAARQPSGLVGMVLCSTFVASPISWLPSSAVRAPLFTVTPLPALEQALLGTFSTPELRRQLRDSLGEVPAATLARRARACLTVNVEAELSLLLQPLLVLSSAHDRVLPSRCARAILAARPDALHREIVAPHLLLQAAPEQAWAEIGGFLSDLGRRASPGKRVVACGVVPPRRLQSPLESSSRLATTPRNDVP